VIYQRGNRPPYRATGLFVISRELTNLIAMTETIKFIICTKIEYNTGIAVAHVIDVPALQKFGKSSINKVGRTIYAIRKDINNGFA
jgi:hypothetical protein